MTPPTSAQRHGVDEGPVVSDTTPLIKLAGVGLLDLLPHLYGAIRIPEAVRDEFEAKAAPGDPDLRALPWLTIQAVASDPHVAAVARLGRGEIAAISLALSAGARAILLDDRLARTVAASRGLPVVGTLAVLVRAKRADLIREVKPVLDQMYAQGRYIGAALRTQVLREVGEDE
jgi:uncharacterized protein